MARRKVSQPPARAATRWVFGVRPVQELLEREAHSIDRIWVARERRSGVGRLMRLAREAAVPVSQLSREQLAARVGRRATHQGVAAQTAPVSYGSAEEICRSAAGRANALLVLVDRVTDSGNLGALLRTCAGAGVEGVILSRDGTAGITSHVVKASAGTAERVPVARESNPARRIQWLQKRGFLGVALDPRARRTWDRVDLTGPIVVVAGGEERGARPGVLEACNTRVAIPLVGNLDSLNVAIATAVLLFEACRQRRRRRGP